MSDLNLKRSESFNKKQVNKSVNSVIKENQLTQKIDEYKYEQSFAELYSQNLNQSLIILNFDSLLLQFQVLHLKNLLVFNDMKIAKN